MKNISRILNAIRGKGFEYFVIDCGWYKADGVPWDISMGDYIPSKNAFPGGAWQNDRGDPRGRHEARYLV